jgi:hypothetical protein
MNEGLKQKYSKAVKAFLIIYVNVSARNVNTAQRKRRFLHDNPMQATRAITAFLRFMLT